MQDSRIPRIIVSDDYVDLRENSDHSRSYSKFSSTRSTAKMHCKHTASLNSEGDYNDRNLIHHGLKKLASSFTNSSGKVPPRGNSLVRNRHKTREHLDSRFRRQVCSEKKSFASQSESTLQAEKLNLPQNSSCSSPSLSERTDHKNSDFMSVKGDVKEHACVDKSTMTESSDAISPFVCNYSYLTNSQLLREPKSCIRWPDPRLLEKYPQILKTSKFKRSWTIPFLGPSSESINIPHGETGKHRHFGEKASTYTYDDGSDLDSAIVLRTKNPSLTFTQYHGKTLLFIMGSICGILLVSTLVWIFFGKHILPDILIIFLRRKELDEHFMKKFIRSVAGTILTLVNTVFITLYRIITIQTNEVLGHNDQFR